VIPGWSRTDSAKFYYPFIGGLDMDNGDNRTLIIQQGRNAHVDRTMSQHAFLPSATLHAEKRRKTQLARGGGWSLCNDVG